MSERLYYGDSYLTEFEARVTDSSPDRRRLSLDRTAFYPTSGGQPFDSGDINGVAVEDVIEEDDRILHVTSAAVAGEEVRCRIDWPRRFDHMQQHTGQHVLSAVLQELFRFPTLSFHLGAESSTIDIGTPSMKPEQVLAAERRVNEVVMENRRVAVVYEDASSAADLRKASDRTGTLRIITIDGLDRSACGGTHVRATGEVGPVLIRKLDRIRDSVRIEFLCGMRALRRARADFEALSAIARSFSSPLDQAPQLAAAQLERVTELERAGRRMTVELAAYRGRELYAAAPPGPDGLRRHRIEIAAGALDDDLRGLARSFASQPQACFLAVIRNPATLLLAVSADAGLHAGNLLKQTLAARGGKGGGSATMAQGSLPSVEALDSLVEELANAGV
jgi:alanyl-tRNA synthetase